MSSQHLRRRGCDSSQAILLEYASLKQVCPDGIYITLTPGNPALWAGVFFVRKGPYASAVLRFQIQFPPSYPSLPPSITFLSDIFHPLVTPLTTYTYANGSFDSETVSTTDEERLPPGGLSLRHGFLQLYRITGAKHGEGDEDGSVPAGGVSEVRKHGSLNIGMILRYLKASFDDEAILDTLPLAATGNSGAWHAWQAHRWTSPGLVRASNNARSGWSWDGVWLDRVQKGINASISDSVLYGKHPGSATDLIQFFP